MRSTSNQARRERIYEIAEEFEARSPLSAMEVIEWAKEIYKEDNPGEFYPDGTRKGSSRTRQPNGLQRAMYRVMKSGIWY